MAVYVVFFMAITVGILVGVVLLLIRDIWGYAYSNELEVVQYVATMMPILATSNIFDGIQCALSGSLQKNIYKFLSHKMSGSIKSKDMDSIL